MYWISSESSQTTRSLSDLSTRLLLLPFFLFTARVEAISILLYQKRLYCRDILKFVTEP